MASLAFNKGLGVDDSLLVYPSSYSAVQLSDPPLWPLHAAFSSLLQRQET